MLTFNVRYQTISKADDVKLVAEAQSYPEAVFNFLTSDWKGKTKTAIFKRVGASQAYHAVLTNDKCIIPHEVLSGGVGQMTVSVFGGSLMTCNNITVDIQSSGYTSGTAPVAPTPTVYNQIITKVDNYQNSVEADMADFEDTLNANLEAYQGNVNTQISGISANVSALASDVNTKYSALSAKDDFNLSLAAKMYDIDELNLWKNGSFEGGTYAPLDSYRIGWEDESKQTGPIYRKMPTICDGVSATGRYSLKVDATKENTFGCLRGGKILTKITKKVDGTETLVDGYASVYACYGMSRVYVAYKIKVTRYVSGKCGIQMFGNSLSQSALTDGWVTKSYVFQNTALETNKACLVGAWGTDDNPADLTAYIDDVVIINLDKHPTLDKATLDYLYSMHTNKNYGKFTGEACFREYKAVCNKTMTKYGLKNSIFVTPSGQVTDTENGKTTCRDLIKLLFAVSGNNDVTRAMSMIEYADLAKYTPSETAVYNVDSRNNIIHIINGGIDASSPSEISSNYFTCVEKGGSHKGADDESVYAKTAAAIAKIEGRLVALAVGNVDDTVGGNTWYSVWSLKIIADYVAEKLKGLTPTQPDIHAECGAAVLLPEYAPGFAHLGETATDSLEYIYSKNPTTEFMPASTSKIAMALLASDYLDLEAMTELSIDDVSTQRVKYPGSGCVLDSRDSLVNRDLLYLAMMISSNQAATALGRLIGKKSLMRKENI